MAKNSSKKVNKAARAGGKVRAGGERKNLGFPAAIALVVVAGLGLVVYARGESTQGLDVRPQLSDHWHSAYAVYECDVLRPNILDTSDPLGIHTHGDGLIHVHPFSSVATGESATLGVFADAAGLTLEDDELRYPGGEAMKEGETTCPDPGASTGDGDESDPGDGVEGIVMVAKWTSTEAARDGEDPEIFTEDLRDIRLLDEGEVYTIAFAPEGTKLEPPPEAGLEALDGYLGGDEGPIEATTTTVDSEESDDDTTTTTTDDGDESNDDESGDSSTTTSTPASDGDDRGTTTTTDE